MHTVILTKASYTIGKENRKQKRTKQQQKDQKHVYLGVSMYTKLYKFQLFSLLYFLQPL